MNKGVQILYGVGHSILRQFTDETKIVALSQLKNVTVTATATDDKLYAADNPYPLATFQKDKAITITADESTFTLDLLNVTQGSSTVVGKVNFTEVETFIIPADGSVTISATPIANSVIVKGFTKAADLAAIAAGQYFPDTTEATLIHFATADAGKYAEIVYEYESSATAETMTVYKDSFSKPFKFIHRVPIYDDNTQIIAKGQLVIYKAQAKNNFDFNLSHQTAFAPKLNLEALDPKRPDKKLWDFTIDYIV